MEQNPNYAKYEEAKPRAESISKLPVKTMNVTSSEFARLSNLPLVPFSMFANNIPIEQASEFKPRVRAQSS